jgi:hypothetical protein
MREPEKHRRDDLPRPKPHILHELYSAFSDWASSHPCDPPQPPKPLILGAYAYSTENDKERRWREMCAWAVRNGCDHVLDAVSDATADDPMIRAHGRDWNRLPLTSAQDTEDSASDR